MNLKEIQEMIHIMDENGITEFQLEKSGFKILLKRGQLAENQMFTQPVMQQQNVSDALATSHKSQEDLPAKDDGVEIIAPMVGTFYAASSPDADPFVKPGQTVIEGDVLCIIEAMKVMNEIKAEMSGTIADILVENGQPLEFGQPLFKIKL